ncbi:major facilitator transporter [Caballeronia calidae]|uniref:Major facilitator transporter n=1 Tax=Caballeronia calidae TaxID=1777139 RepID=A0A158EI66_9BURK|nr:MFS transporter [Caballeronia calidae]SAL06086.1 major facilitator transporter [Caballeronia calidae]
MASRRWRPAAADVVLFLICLLYLIQYSDRVNIATAASAISHDLHLSNVELGFAFSAFAYPYAVVQLFGGWLGDKVGPRRILMWFGLTVALASVLTAFAGGLWSLAACRFLLGVGEAPSLSTATSAMSRWLPVERRGFAQGITHACSRVGSALTPPVIALLMTLWNWRVAFVLAGVIGILWVVCWFWYFRDEPASHKGVTKEELAMLPVARDKTEKVKVPVRRLLVRMLPVTVVDFCYAWTLWVFLTWLPSFFLHSYNMNLKSSALFTSGVFVAGILGDTLGGMISDKVFKRTGDLKKARRNVIIGGMAGALVFLIPVLLVKDLTVVAASLCCAFFCMELVIAPLWSVPMDIAPRFAGTASSFMNIGFGIAGVLSPLTFGFIIDRTGNWTLPFLLSIAMLVVGIVFSFWMHPERPLPQDDEPELEPVTTAA